MAMKKTRENASKKTSPQKINKKKIIRVLLPISIVAIIVYLLYTIIHLIIVPTDMFVIRNDIISAEETTIRICNKRRKNGKGQ